MYTKNEIVFLFRCSSKPSSLDIVNFLKLSTINHYLPFEVLLKCKEFSVVLQYFLSLDQKKKIINIAFDVFLQSLSPNWNCIFLISISPASIGFAIIVLSLKNRIFAMFLAYYRIRRNMICFDRVKKIWLIFKLSQPCIYYVVSKSI